MLDIPVGVFKRLCAVYKIVGNTTVSIVTGILLPWGLVCLPGIRRARLDCWVQKVMVQHVAGSGCVLWWKPFCLENYSFGFMKFLWRLEPPDFV